MFLYDTLSSKKKRFIPRNKKSVDLFVCGPTVYDYSHIGHGRTYIFFDALTKYLRMQKFNVRYVQNITDIDDKIIARAQRESTPWNELAHKFEQEYYADMQALGVSSITKYARATDYMAAIIHQIETLIKKGFAYQTKTGVYFEVAKFSDYGKLSGQKLAMIRKAARTEIDPTKKQPEDFALWKMSKIGEPFGGTQGEPSWSSPWGDGRPGWHIEDTAITETEFGAQYDIHGGARDLIFPHHESEIAQMEASSGKKPLVRYWLHTGFLTIGAEKMSKSLGNFITIRSLLSRYSAQDFRLFVLGKHYRSPISYDEKYMREARGQRMRVEEFIRRLSDVLASSSARSELVERVEEKGKSSVTTAAAITRFQKQFWTKLADDFNTPQALAVLSKLMTYFNARLDKNTVDKADAKKIIAFLHSVDDVLGIIEWNKTQTQEIPVAIQDLVAKREFLRAEKKWQEADDARKEIDSQGYVIEDTSEGPKIHAKG
ncbi:MAG: cysteine--tRNA ligase [Candidatus Spechtbacteria bacterium]|nr:cysteine--tRNA ligase [Candidatus Spechtbacteria bacterium]